MKFYYCDNMYFGTLAFAKEHARWRAKESYFDIEVDVVEVSTSKDNMLRLLGDGGGVHSVVLENVFIAKARKQKSDDL